MIETKSFDDDPDRKLSKLNHVFFKKLRPKIEIPEFHGLAVSRKTRHDNLYYFKLTIKNTQN